MTRVIVAGSGASGLTAALAAAAAGADVLVLERTGLLGGTTALGGGRVWVPANHFPENAGDSPAAARVYLDWLLPGQYAHMTEAFVSRAGEMARFVETHSSHRFAACPRYPDYYPGRPGATLGGRCLDMLPADLSAIVPLARQVRVSPVYLPMTHAEWERWRYPDRYDWDLLRDRNRNQVAAGGPALVAVLADGVIRAGARIQASTRLIDVTVGDDGAVTGVVAERGGTGRDAVTVHVPASAVILATGGFDWDEGLRRAGHPAARRATGAPPGNTGDALRIAARLGAVTANLAEGWWMPMIEVPGEEADGRPCYRALIRERAVPRQIMVNAAGRRFTDEAASCHEVGRAMRGRDARGCPNDPAYLVFDAGFARRYPLPGITSGTVADWVPRARSLAALARLIGVDPGGLERTARQWNMACADGADPEFGRGGNPSDRYGGDLDAAPSPNLGPLTEPPFYAVRVLAGTTGTKGGPVTDANGTVLTEKDNPVPGLYAVGDAAAFWAGDACPAPGAALGFGMTMGYLAGRHAALTR